MSANINGKWVFRVLQVGLVGGVFALASGCLWRSVTIQILHVNDLHSYFESYGPLKFQLDRLKADAKSKGQESVVLNAGDSFEGSPYYFADHGSQSAKLLAAFSFDASTIGNHDFLMGPAQFDRLLGELPEATKVLGANFKFDHALYPHVASKLLPFVELTRGGLKIAVLGLTTDDVLYSWAAGDISITNPLVKALEMIPVLKSRNDILIVLSHLGTAADIKLVERTAGIDLVVGGHDHVPLPQPLLKKDLLGRQVPILQAPSFGAGIGKMVVTVKRNLTYKIESYGFEPVSPEGPQDPLIHGLVEDAKVALGKQLGEAWLQEKIGSLSVDVAAAANPGKFWGDFAASAFREATHADIGIDAEAFRGDPQPFSSITHLNVMNLYPRLFEFTQNKGWTLWTLKLPGAVLPKIVELAVSMGFPLSFSGVSFTQSQENGKAVYSDFKIGGAAVDPLALYTLVLPEGVARGMIEIPKKFGPEVSGLAAKIATSSFSMEPVVGFLLEELSAFTNTIEDTHNLIWDAMEQKIAFNSK